MKSDTYLILNAARPRGQDDALPEVASALEEIQSDDPALAWLADMRTHDTKLGEALRSIDPPQGFREHLHQATAQSGKRTAPGLSRRQILGWPIAAAAAAVLGGAYWWRLANSGIALDKLMALVSDISAKGVTLSLMSMDKPAVVNWLVNAGAPRANTLPPKLDGVTRKGCHLYDLEGHPVSLECFIIPEGMRELHLFTIRSAELRDPPADTTAIQVTAAADGQTVGLWSSDEHTMVLVSKEPVEAVRALLS